MIRLSLVLALIGSPALAQAQPITSPSLPMPFPAPEMTPMITTMPNVFGGVNIYAPGQAPITTMPNVFGGQNVYMPIVAPIAR